MQDKPTNTTSVGTIKAHLSELLARVAFGGERYLIERRGKPIAALVSVDDLKHLEAGHGSVPPAPHRIVDAIGAWEGVISEEEWNEILADIYRARATSFDRPVDLEG
ncbi:MAG: type II toxin-antitoxin system Phd/YefM family antitoxin [Dehalococcoidia bacterium]